VVELVIFATITIARKTFMVSSPARTDFA